MAAFPPVTGIRLGIGQASGFGDFGHLVWDISLQGQSDIFVEAGPSGPAGTGSLVSQNYGFTANSTNSVSVPLVYNLDNLAQGLLNGAQSYTANGPVPYGATGQNSNTYAYADGQSAGIDNGTLDGLIQQLSSQTGLNPIGGDATDALQSGLTSLLGGATQVSGDPTPTDGGDGGSTVRLG